MFFLNIGSDFDSRCTEACHGAKSMVKMKNEGKMADRISKQLYVLMYLNMGITIYSNDEYF